MTLLIDCAGRLSAWKRALGPLLSVKQRVSHQCTPAKLAPSERSCRSMMPSGSFRRFGHRLETEVCPHTSTHPGTMQPAHAYAEDNSILVDEKRSAFGLGFLSLSPRHGCRHPLGAPSLMANGSYNWKTYDQDMARGRLSQRTQSTSTNWCDSMRAPEGAPLKVRKF